MSRYNTVLFDFDGTLVDSQEGILGTFHYVLQQLGIGVDDEQLKKYIGPPLRDSFAELLGDDRADLGVEYYRKRFADTKAMLQVTVYPGVSDMLEALQEAGCTLVVATSKNQTHTQEILAHFGLARYFHKVVGGIPETGRFDKPSIIAEVFEDGRLRKDRSVMVGDREYDLIGARDNSIDAIGVLYGFGSPEELTAYPSVFLADSAGAVTRYILM